MLLTQSKSRMSMNQELKLLLLEDDPNDAELIQRLLQRAGMKFKAIVASDADEFMSAMREEGFHAVLADNALPQYSSIEALKLIRTTNPHVAFILVTGTVSEEFAVNIIQQGADDYILKTNLTRLPAAISNAITKKRMQRDKELAEKEIENEKELSGSIINSLPGIFYFCDIDGKFLRWNKNFEKISGYSIEDIGRMLPEHFFSGKDRQNVRRFIKDVFFKGQGEMEVNLMTRNMQEICYYFTGMAVAFEKKNCLICVGLDISASKQSEKDLKRLNEELRTVSANMEKIREEEQARIAREIHDQLGQQLTGLKMDLSWVRDKMGKNISQDKLMEKLNEMSVMMDEAVVTIRKVASDLRPSILDHFGLVEALEWQSKEFTKRSGIPVHFTDQTGQMIFSPLLAIGIYRIYQEALTNIARHADAKNVRSSLDLLPDLLVFRISDDGKGFNTRDTKKTLGVLGMKERAYMVGGNLNIESDTGKGTTIIITVPIAHANGG
jgi:two-component system sensor histidine kinase UhpB